MHSADSIVDSVIGADFDIPCRLIRVLLRDRSSGPEPELFAGPGYLRSSDGGEIHYELLDQRKRSAREAEIVRTWLASGSNAFVIEAEAYSGVQWLGYWHAPTATWPEAGGAIVRGHFSQMTADFISAEETNRSTTSELHYNGLLDLPPQALEGRTGFRFRDGFVQIGERARHAFAFVQGTGIEGPSVESWLDEALSFSLGYCVRHRVALRFHEKRTVVFVRDASVQTSSGMPRAVMPLDQYEAFWSILSHYLDHCVRENCFSPVCNLSAVWCEVLLASTGTIHSFVFALVAAIESVARDIVAPKGEKPTKLQALVQHITLWEGDSELKQRALGILSQLSSPATGHLLTRLAEEGVLTKAQLKIWKKLRPKLAHGQVLDYFHANVAQWREELVDLLYRLALRRIGYRGQFFSQVVGTPVEFSWRTRQPDSQPSDASE